MRVVKVLIIEDSQQWQKSLERIFDSAGKRSNLVFQCLIAENHFVALELLREKPSIITLDLSLREGNDQYKNWEGWQIAKYANDYSIPIVVVTGFGDVTTVKRAFREYRVHDFFDKSDFDIHAFENAIIEIIFSLTLQPRVHLRHMLNQYFSDSELNNLCFDLQVDYENLATNKSDKVRELIVLMERERRLPELVTIAYQSRPTAPWGDTLDNLLLYFTH